MQENLFLAPSDPLKWGASSVKDCSKSGNFDGGCPSLNRVKWSWNQVFCKGFDPNNLETASKWDILKVDYVPSLPYNCQGAASLVKYQTQWNHFCDPSPNYLGQIHAGKPVFSIIGPFKVRGIPCQRSFKKRRLWRRLPLTQQGQMELKSSFL